MKSHDIHIDADYAVWIADIKSRYHSSQVKAAVKVNAEKLLFNWQLGRDLVQKKAEEHWGTGIIEQVSLDLKRKFPNADGFSVRNLWYMKQWYLFYTQGEDSILHQLGAELQRTENQYVSRIMMEAAHNADSRVKARYVAELNAAFFMKHPPQPFPTRKEKEMASSREVISFLCILTGRRTGKTGNPLHPCSSFSSVQSVQSVFRKKYPW